MLFVAPSPDEQILLNMTLRLLLNLSFDGPLCEAMVKEGLLPKLVALLGQQGHHHQWAGLHTVEYCPTPPHPLGNESERVLVLCILYHISILDKCRPMFSLTDCIGTVRVCVCVCEREREKGKGRGRGHWHRKRYCRKKWSQ